MTQIARQRKNVLEAVDLLKLMLTLQIPHLVKAFNPLPSSAQSAKAAVPAVPAVPAASRLDRTFYRQPPVTVAKALLGQRLVHITENTSVAGLIVETEAYLGYEDKAAHSFNWRRTPRTETMFCDGGTAYVFLNYGLHHLLNIVVAGVDVPQAVLIRAVEPTEGLDVMRQRRPKAKRDIDLCSGPGKVGAAFGVDRSHNGTDLTVSPTLFVERLRQRTVNADRIVTRPRVGVDYAGDWAAAPLRFYLKGNPHVSVR